MFMDKQTPSMSRLKDEWVSLAKILEMRARPLEECNLWCLLYRTVETVQELFEKDQACKNSLPRFLVTPESLLCTSTGDVVLNDSLSSDIEAMKYWCSELKVNECFTNGNLEKVYVFMIGQTMTHAAYYLDKINVELSPLVKSLLQTMSQMDDNLKMTLADVAEVCASHTTKYMNGNSYSHAIASLYHSGLGDRWQGENFSGVNCYSNTDDNNGKSNNDPEEFSETLSKLKNFLRSPKTVCHQMVSSYSWHSKSIIAPTPKERWKKAYNKIIKRIKDTSLSTGKDDHLRKSRKQHKSDMPVLEVFEKFTERWKILELLRLSLNMEPFVPADIYEDAFGRAGLKPKTLAELAILLQCTAKQLAINCATESYNSISCHNVDGIKVQNSVINKHLQKDSISMRPYYHIDKIVLEASSLIRNSCSQKKHFWGPEFVIGRLRPHSKLTLVNSDQNEAAMTESTFTVIITLLNGEHIGIECSLSVTGKILYQAVVHHIKLQEQYLFGLAYFDGGEFIFIDRKQKVSSLLNPNNVHCSVVGSAIELFLHVRFYLDDIHLMRSQYIRHLYYLQLRKNFVEDDFTCHSNTAISLGGLALQAEFGNYDFEECGENYFLIEHYLSISVINQEDRDQLKLKLHNQHSSFRGMSTEQAELKFIQEMLKTSMYGYHFHKVLQDRNNADSAVWLGIYSHGVDIFENVFGMKRLKKKNLWQHIQRISFTKKYFCIASKVGDHSGKLAVDRFFTPLPYRSHYLFTISMSHHKFHLKLKSITKASQIFIDGLDLEITHSSEDILPDNRFEKEIGCDLVDDDVFALNCQNSTQHVIQTGVRNPQILLQFHSGKHTNRKRAAQLVTRSASAPESVKISISFRTSTADFSQDPHARISSTMPRASCKKQDLKFVRLLKNQDKGLGMVITCGNTYETVLHGAFVEAITPGGPVDLDGNISPGDQILCVNGTDVRNNNFLDVVDLLQHSKSPVELVISKPNRSQLHSSFFPEKEIEPLCIKTESWVTDSIHSKDTMVIGQKNNNDDICEGDVPIPTPRKKWIEKGKLNMNYPDLTLNHAMASDPNASWESEGSPDMRENCNIPDIVPSQVKCADVSKVPDHEHNGGIIENGSALNLPGELYHVVLDKQGGTLGLNIYQGIEPSCPLERNIYVHSTVSGGAAELNGKISPGDKLLKVNSISLENLSYQEVVTKLRESPQVVHLVLEKRTIVAENTLDSNLNTNNVNAQLISAEHYLPMNSKAPQEYVPMSPKTSLENYVPMTFSVRDALSTRSDSLPSNGCDTNKNGFEPDLTSDANSEYIEECSTKSIDESSASSMSFNCSNLNESCKISPTNSLSMSSPLPNDNDLQTKERNSASYQNLNGSTLKQHQKSYNDLLSPKIAKCCNNALTPSPNTKGNSLLTSYKSTPNLADDSDDEDSDHLCVESSLSRNSKSTDCLLSSPYFLNPHLALIDLYQNYTFVRSSSSINQIPTVPIRKKKLRKLADVYNFCNEENTFAIDIRKSSRGLGISISGGRELNSKDSFSQLIRIRKLYPLQPALECGKLQLGDVILEVNGTSMIGLSNTEALEVLRCAPPDVILKVFRPSKSLIPSFSMYKDSCWPFIDSSSSSASSSLSRCETKAYNIETGEFEVTLMKREGSLGFTIFQHDENMVDNTPAGIYIKALIREPAVSDGRIQPGDRIINVNGTCISSMTHMEAISFIRNTPNTVVLNMFRMDPPLSPGYIEDDHHISKPLRWEAVELINDRGREKDNGEECNTLKRKLNRKLDRNTYAVSDSSVKSDSASSMSSGQEYVINEDVEDIPGDHLSEDIITESLVINEDCLCDDEDYVEGPGLQRNQRPKSLDVLNSSDRKRINVQGGEESFHRQASVMCSVADGKNNSNGNEIKGERGVTLLKWRGSTLHDSEDAASPDLSKCGMQCDSLNSIDEPLSMDQVDQDDDEKPVPLPRTTSAVSNEWVETFNVVLDRAWQTRLGFSLFDALPASPKSRKFSLPAAAEVKAVHPGSLAEKDGRIKIGDRLIEVNQESLLGKTAVEVIDILRKTRGVIRMVLCRLKSES